MVFLGLSTPLYFAQEAPSPKALRGCKILNLYKNNENHVKNYPPPSGFDKIPIFAFATMLKEMTMRKLFLLILALCSVQMQAQKYSVSGRATDDATPPTDLPMAKIQLLTPDSTVAAVGTTDNEGRFSLKVKNPGNYLLRATFIGCRPAQKQVELTQKKPKADLGRLVLALDAQQLDEAQVTALSQQLTIKADTFVYHTNAFRLPPGASLAALMTQLPGLQMDKDGNLTFQGKSVSNILVNGKPFFDDAQTALVNLPVDAVQNVQIYEKTDEDKEFSGSIDMDKQTVVDLKIKKEWMSAWNVNMEAAGGTEDKYVGKLFASNFDDRRRAILYGSANNISSAMQVDENGNWQNWGGAWGQNTYRNAGAIFSYDNGKKEKEAGYLRTTLRFKARHDSRDLKEQSISETFLGNNSSHHGFDDHINKNDSRGLSIGGELQLNIDSMNRLTAKGSYSYSDNSMRTRNKKSVYTQRPDADNPFTALLGDNVSDDLKQIGVYGMEERTENTSDSHYINGDINYLHRCAKEGRSLRARVRYSGNRDDGGNDILRRYSYFNAAAPKPENIDRDWQTADNSAYKLTAMVGLEEPLGKKLQLGLGYMFDHVQESGREYLYRLARYDYYNSMQPPFGLHPVTADSLLHVLDADNTFTMSRLANTHTAMAEVKGQWNKFKAGLGLEGGYRNEKLWYRREGNDHDLSRSYLHIRPKLNVEWKFVENGTFRLHYRVNNERPELEQILPVTESSDEMNISRGNADLKESWRQFATFSFNYFNKKRGDSYSAYGYGYLTHRPVVSTLVINPLTGAKENGFKNSGKTHQNYHLSLSTEQPLDSARHWSFRLRAGGSYGMSEAFMGSAAGAFGLTEVKTYNLTASTSLSWRKGIWNVVLSGGLWRPLARYATTPQYNETARGYEVKLTPQIDLPFGLKCSTSMHYYARRGYNTPEMNSDQWIWNAGLSQSFLKDKSLTLRLEAVDLLHSRTTNDSDSSPTGRSYTLTNSVMSYVMLHAVWRFSVK